MTFSYVIRWDLRIEKLWGDIRTDIRTDVRKFTPVFYRTSALWGRCPKKVSIYFLGAPTHLYNWLCPLVGWLVCGSGNAFVPRSAPLKTSMNTSKKDSVNMSQKTVA